MISALKGQSGPILVGVVSWTFATLQKHQFETRQAEVATIAEKIRVLYGPLRGNRLVYRSSYAAITQDQPLKDWLQKAQETKNKEMIIAWRKIATPSNLRNSSLVIEKADQMDDNDLLVENNLIGFRCKRKNSTDPFGDCGNCALSSYVDGVLDELQTRKNELEGHLQSHSSIWGSMVALFAIFASYAQ
ncbi:Oidioi.mRNA.OKI2018_I69.chr2.g8303.t1.cds [Oikopleura dioica]|uniref:Oidioi.mRNA.OKI2018_I69.chr2.g8303.t1.cds n=1 Tax=Oikopleura dioica TaxID=34765 RepID=A0ABN7TC42_OIKDI|nr:Oidioi.mRNA.OKI2018_I69.chr2.g8303.t1.cds [Oikopleura dioica]